MANATGRPEATLARNTVAQSVPPMLAYLFGFLIAPLTLSRLGLHAFGIWALTGGFAQYGSLLDLGVGQSLGRFVALHGENRERIGEYIAVALALTTLVALILAIAALAGAAPLAGLLTRIATGEMRAVLLSSVVMLSTAMAGRAIAAYPVGLRQMGSPNIALAISGGLNFLFSVGVLLLRPTLPAYAEASAAASVVGVVVMIVMVTRAVGTIPLALPNGHRYRELLPYSVKAQLVTLSDLVNYQSDKIIIALSVGPSAAGAYELANRIAGASRTIGISASVSAMLPTMTAEITRNGLAHARARYVELTEKAAALAFPALFLVAALAPILLAAWLGQPPSHSAAILCALSLAYVVNVSSGVGYCLASAAGKPGLPARTSVATAVANVALTATLAPFFGLWGVLAGTVIALTLGAFGQVAVVQRHFNVPLADYFNAVVSTLSMCVGLAIPIAVVSYVVGSQGRLLNVAMVVVATSTYAAVYLMWATHSNKLPKSVAKRVQLSLRPLSTAP